MPNLYGVSSALRTTNRQMESAAKSGANANTAGFRQTFAVTKTSGYVSEGSELKATNAVAAKNSRQYARSTKVAEVYESEAEPELKETGKSTHVAITGAGYVAVAAVHLGDLSADHMHTVNPTLNTAGQLVRAYGANGLRATLDGTAAGGVFTNAAFVRDTGAITTGDADVAVAPVNVIPMSAAAGRHDAANRKNFGLNAVSAPGRASGDGLDVRYTQIGDLHWDSIEVDTSVIVVGPPPAVALKHTDNRLVTSDGRFAVGWVNINANHPTNKRPQWMRGHADVGNLLDRADANYAAGAGNGPGTAGYAGFVDVPCTNANACVIRVQNLKDYSDVRINGDGEIVGNKAGETVILAKLANVMFDSPDSLIKAENGTLIGSQAAGQPKFVTAGTAGSGNFEAGMLVGSNADMSECSVEFAQAKATHVFTNNVVNSTLQILEQDANIIRGV